MDDPAVAYARAPDGVYLAYEQFGSGPIDIVFVDGVPTNLESRWANPLTAALFRRLARFSRVTSFDRRGTGLSDRGMEIPPVEEQVDDLLAVMDEAGIEDPVLLGVQTGAALGALAVASHPAAFRALVVYAMAPRRLQADDWPHGMTAAENTEIRRALDRTDYEPLMRLIMPSFADDPEARRLYAETRRRSVGPSASAAARHSTDDLDIRGVLPSISVPTLVLQPCGRAFLSVENGRYTAAHVPGARLVELPWPDLLFVDPHRVADEIEEFVTGAPPVVHADRTLATVLFTDIVGSTERAAALGDVEWKRLLRRHDKTAAKAVARFRGDLVKTTGDGVLATFDGPARAVACASDLVRRCDDLGLAIRVGLHTGEVELSDEDIGGMAVHIAARIQDLAEPSEILVSRTVKDLVAGSGIEFEDRGVRELKGVPEPWQVLAVRDRGDTER